MQNFISSQTNAQPKVLMVSPEYPPYMVEGGLGTHVSELAQGLARAGCEVTVLAPSNGDSVTHRDGAVEVHLISLKGITGTPSVPKFIGEITRYASDFGGRMLAEGQTLPDVIHCHDWTSIKAARELGKVLDVPVVGTVHLLQHPLYAWCGAQMSPEVVEQESYLCRKADALITVSRAMSRVIQDTYNIPAERLHVVHNGLDADAFIKRRLPREQRDELRAGLQSAPGEKIVLFAGRLTPQKGIGALLDSAARVLAENPRVRYVIVGGVGYFDAQRSPQQAQAKILEGLRAQYPQHDASLWEHVKIMGMIPRAQVAMLYQAADLAVVPSVYEPFGYAAVEAMAAGLPVVASDAGGLSEIVVDGETGLLVPVHTDAHGVRAVDAEKLAEAQLSILNDDALAARFAEAGRLRVAEVFTPERMIQSTLAVYAQVISTFDACAQAIHA
ncbi:MAG TPA: glycosyltransferase family 4 protein [Pyrinomonadaceae bacterium]|nr:glycosyltransferase family 4 protein [Pyrinomonadaceae bacterium]